MDSSNHVDIGDIGNEIAKCMGEYTSEVSAKLSMAIDEIGEETLQEVKKNSPVKTGRYKKTWRKKTDNAFSGDKKVTVLNVYSWRLTHLLEFGHLNRDGTSRTKAIPHIKSAEERAQKKLLDRIGRELK